MTTTFPEFASLARRFNMIAVRQDIVVDRATPVSLFEHLQAGEPYAYLLESVEGGERFGRYSFIGQRPRAVFKSNGNKVTYLEGTKERRWETQNPLIDLKKLFAGIHPAPVADEGRFTGGAVGYWDYDTVRFFEKISNDTPDPLRLPNGVFQLSGEGVVLDRFSQTAQVLVNVFIPEAKRSTKELKRLYTQAVKSIKRQISRIQATPRSMRSKTQASLKAPRALTTQKQYESAVESAKEHIRAGDIIQVVLSQRWVMDRHPRPFDIYRALRMVNPSPYMYYVRSPDVELVGSSPELLVRKEGNMAETRPIAGTRKRGATEAEDQALARELLADPKERAEHLMLVDLGRNDLGRVCEPGTVKVPELMTIENYSHVMHLVSSVTGKLGPEANAFDLFQASFPAGTVTGAPKIRAMQIIDTLEPMRRGPYAGAVGYFSYTGNMDMAITIRTLFFHRGKAYMQAGAGIVADSVPSHEYQECQHKAAALFAAVQKAQTL